MQKNVYTTLIIMMINTKQAEKAHYTVNKCNHKRHQHKTTIQSQWMYKITSPQKKNKLCDQYKNTILKIQLFRKRTRSMM